MIDLHAHILPGLDDGPVDMDASLALARIYAQTGFTYVAATPHAVGMALDFAGTVRRAVVSINRALRQHAIAVRVLPGMEVGLDPRLAEFVAGGAILPLANKNHLLVETPFMRMPLGWQNIVFDLAAGGITVVFAHPERCLHIMQDNAILNEMVMLGAKLQVNWDSFAGAYGREPRHLARRMAEQGLIHCLATDSHDCVKRQPGCVTALWADLTQRVGQANLRRIALENPVRALRGLAMTDMQAAGALKRPKRFRWWRWASA